MEQKKLYQSLNLVGSITLAFTIPWIIFKVLRAIYLKRRYNDLQSKVVVITGASSGLGEALAHEFYKEGCQVVLCARRRQELDRVRTELLSLPCSRPSHPPIIMPLDLSDINSLPTVVHKILTITGQIDILVNNGGISNRGSIVDTKPDVDIKVMLVNYFGSIALTKAVLPSLIKRKNGSIVFISSIQGLIALPDRSSYCASKHALQAFADSLRAEVSSYNIAVTIISPGYVKTKLSLNALTETGEKHGVMDTNTANGYDPQYVSERILKAVVQKEKEVVIAGILPKIAISLRKYFPSMYFYIMTLRAKKPISQEANQ
ncbi:hypothetical protein WA026_008052 [Henosepilachna vigintioctopunctata]|uniref:Dehydrogenase/reductase SDR family protein 7-like n=1 Tax=Henosepilachna vigintioctopunctata TaxID=420089 RepID=A0AAW1TP96_9CUCU